MSASQLDMPYYGMAASINHDQPYSAAPHQGTSLLKHLYTKDPNQFLEAFHLIKDCGIHGYEGHITDIAQLAVASNDVHTLKLICNDYSNLLKIHDETLCKIAFEDAHKRKEAILFLFDNMCPGAENTKQLEILLNYCLPALKEYDENLKLNQDNNQGITQFYDKIYFQAYKELLIAFLEKNRTLAALPEIHDLAFHSEDLLHYLIKNRIREFVTAKNLFKLIQLDEQLEIAIAVVRELQDFPVDDYMENGYTSLILALEKGNIKLAEELIAMGAQIEKVFEFVLQEYPASMLVFSNALLLPLFNNIIKMDKLIRKKDYKKICLALSHGIQCDDVSLQKDLDPHLHSLLTQFKKISAAASNMKLKLNKSSMINLIKSVFKQRPIYRQFLLASHPESKLLTKLAQRPNEVQEIIQKEIETHIFQGIPESYYLQELLFIKANISSFKKPTQHKIIINKAISFCRKN